MPISQPVSLTWSPADTPPELAAMLRCLADEYPLHEGTQANVRFCHDADCTGYSIERSGGVATVSYGRLSQAGRAIGSLLAGLDEDRGSQPAFSTLGDAFR